LPLCYKSTDVKAIIVPSFLGYFNELAYEKALHVDTSTDGLHKNCLGVDVSP
jgi:hypothetical protein